MRMKPLLFVLAISLGSLRADMTAQQMLMKAIAGGDLKTVESLLALGVDPNLPFGPGQTPLAFAMVALNDAGAVRLLLAHHADPDAPLNGRSGLPFPFTPLDHAARAGDLSMASLLIGAGAHVDTKGPEGRTALHLAAAAGRLDMVHLLLEKGADPNVRDAEGASPFDNAVWRGDLDTVALLLAHGAHLNDTDTQTGATPIGEAAWRGNSAVLRYLLLFHPDLGIPDKGGRSPLDNAIRTGKEDSAPVLLLDAEADQLRTPGFAGRTMDAAARKDELLVVEYLLHHGQVANGALPSGATPLVAGAARSKARAR